MEVQISCESDAILRPRNNIHRDSRDEEEEGRESVESDLSEAPRRHSMALSDVTRLCYCLLVLVVGLLILVTAEIMMLKGQRTTAFSSSHRTVVFLRELCFQPEVNVTRLEEMASQFLASLDEDDSEDSGVSMDVDVLPRSGKFIFIVLKYLVLLLEFYSRMCHP